MPIEEKKIVIVGEPGTERLLVGPEQGAVVITDKIAREPVSISSLPPLDSDGYRTCALDSCKQQFKPESRERVGSAAGSFAYCSDECAIVAFYRKQGLEPPAKIVRHVERDVATAQQTTERSEREQRKAERYGPLRDIIEEISKGRTSRRVRFTCQHLGSVAAHAKRGRCRHCKPPKTTREPVARDEESTTMQERESVDVYNPTIETSHVTRDPEPIEPVVDLDSSKKNDDWLKEARKTREAKKPMKRTPVKTKKGKRR